MFRTPQPNAAMSNLENCGTEQLLGIFEYCLKTGCRTGAYGDLPDAWGILFFSTYLSDRELVDEMQKGEHRLGEDKERMLREFIRADCASGGTFVMDVIKKGGKTDRAALIMIADLENLAGIEHNGMTAIHLLADACDKGVRQALIGRAGKRLLSSVYDQRGIPVLFSIFVLSDLCMSDLDAIAKVFSEDDLRKVMNKSRAGMNALEVFTDASRRLKSHAPSERNRFELIHAVKTTNMGGAIRAQVNTPGHHESVRDAQVKAADGTKTELEKDGMTGASERYEALMPDSQDDIGNIMKKTQKTR